MWFLAFLTTTPDKPFKNISVCEKSYRLSASSPTRTTIPIMPSMANRQYCISGVVVLPVGARSRLFLPHSLGNPVQGCSTFSFRRPPFREQDVGELFLRPSTFSLSRPRVRPRPRAPSHCPASSICFLRRCKRRQRPRRELSPCRSLWKPWQGKPSLSRWGSERRCSNTPDEARPRCRGRARGL